MIKFKTIFVILSFLFILPALHSQEALKSYEENYYDFFALNGEAKRPTLNYRTLSDSVWEIGGDEEHPWQEQNLGKWQKLFGRFRMRVYGPELFMSGNTSTPYGQNDGVLWQGRGFNSSFKTGLRFEGYGLELTLIPHLAFSQNAEFEYIQPNQYYSGEDFKEKAEKYGYYGIEYIDAPQRFGDKPFFDWDFGDSEIRYSWKTLTIGFGTQSIWLGPAQLNPIIHSNNAASYPKLDMGLRRQSIKIPKVNWHLGDIEFRVWWGYLSESGYFDNNDTNNNNLITGISVGYNFPYLFNGLSIGFNRIMLLKWDKMNYGSVFTLMWPFMDTKFGYDENDQRASIIIDYLLPLAGINVYFEWGRNDYSTNAESTFAYPFHTAGYTFGVKKTLSFSPYLKGEILLEFTKLECSQDYDRLISWYSTFYAHHIITQGHTNRGQWLGAGIGTGGNSQYLEFKLYYPRGFGNIFVQRRNPDLDYSYFIDSKDDDEYSANYSIRAFFDIGISGQFFLMPNLSAAGTFVFRDELNPLNKSAEPNGEKAAHRFNVYLSASVKYTF